MQTNTQAILEWQAPSRIAPVRSQEWYLVTGILAATFIVYGIISGTWVLSVIFALLAGLFFVGRNQSHPVHTVRIRETGLEVDGQIRIWADWKHFWILQGDGYHELHVETDKRFASDLVILTGEIDPYLIRDTLAEFLPQIDHQKEKILDAIIRFCKL